MKLRSGFTYEFKPKIPKKKIIHANLIEKLRYGENAHQQSAIYSQKDKLDQDLWELQEIG